MDLWHANPVVNLFTTKKMFGSFVTHRCKFLSNFVRYIINYIVYFSCNNDADMLREGRLLSIIIQYLFIHMSMISSHDTTKEVMIFQE